MECGRRKLWISLGLGFLVLIGYGRVCFHDFVNYDDPDYVSANAQVQAGLTGSSIPWAFTSFHAHNWHPLTWLSLQLDSQLFGPRPWGFHLTNLLLHVANALLLFLVLNRMTGAIWSSAFVAALFGIHPLHVESVAWVAERKDVLSTLFWMLTLWAYAGYVEHPGLPQYLLVMLGLVLGLMAKPMVVTLPFVLLLLDYWPLGRCGASGLSPIWEKIPLIALVILAGVITLFAQRGAIVEEDYLPMSARVANAVLAYVSYIGMMLWPSGLAVFYPHPFGALPVWKVVGAALLLVLMTGLASWQARRRPYLIVGWLWFLGTLVPVIGLIQAGNQAMADRFTYVPLIGLFIGLTWGIRDLAAGLARRASLPAKWLVFSGCFVLFLLTACSWIQAGYWRDSRTLWEHALEVTQNNPVAHNNLGVALWEAGAYEEAAGHFGDAYRIQPKYGNAKHNLEVAHYELGMMRRSQRRWPEAQDHFLQATRVAPDNDAAFAQRGIVLGFLEKWPEAVECFKQAVNLQPDVAQYRADLALSFQESGQVESAQLQYREASRLDPAWPERARQAAWVMATHPDSSRRDGGRALQLARQICQAAPKVRPESVDTLAAAYAEMGQFAEAIPTARAALQLAGSVPRGSPEAPETTNLAQQIQARLQLYEKGQPYRDQALPQGEKPQRSGTPVPEMQK